MAFFLTSRMVLDLFDHFQIFWQLYLIELLGLLAVLGLHDLWHLIYPRLLTGFGMLVFFTNVSLMVFQVRYLALFLLFSVIDFIGWFWMKFSQEYPVKTGVPQWSIFCPALFLLYINDLTMLCVIFLSMLMILLSTLNVIRHLICGNN